MYDHLLTPTVIAIRQLQGELSLLEARLMAVATATQTAANELGVDFAEVIRRSSPLTQTLDTKPANG